MNNITKQLIESKYNFNIDVFPVEQTLSKSKRTMYSQKESYVNSLFVDFNLPSKNLWAKYNLGVNPDKLDDRLDWFGDYYSWGEVNTKNGDHTWLRYKYGNQTRLEKYSTNREAGKDGFIDMKTHLDLEDDAAYVNSTNVKLKMPTHDDFEELIQGTYQEEAYNYKGIPNLNGMILKSPNNDNINIFIPCGGFISTEVIGRITRNEGKEAYYWSNELIYRGPSQAYILSINHNGAFFLMKTSVTDRCKGLLIRPIKYIEKENEEI